MNSIVRLRRLAVTLGATVFLLAQPEFASADTVAYLTEVPDYEWYAGCFGTANGNLMGYWDRHGFPNFYAGPTAGGVAPLHSFASNGGIRSLWATKAGVDGRASTNFGHMDNYYVDYQSTDADPYKGRRPEHPPECIGDFIGLNQNKWTNLNSECDGNIDAFSFVYWDATGNRRTNFTPTAAAGPPIDIQSGLRAWTKSRGYDADVFTQLTDFNPHTPPGKGFTFEDMKAEVDAGYPILIFLQDYDKTYRSLGTMAKANPEIHGMLIYGYQIGDDGTKIAIYRTSWGQGEYSSEWTSADWQAFMPVRGVIGFRPKPKITSIRRQSGNLIFEWDGPSSEIYDPINGGTRRPHWYVIERSTSLTPASFSAVAPESNNRTLTIPDPGTSAFYRVRLQSH